MDRRRNPGRKWRLWLAAGVAACLLANGAWVWLSWGLPQGEKLRAETRARCRTHGAALWLALPAISGKLRTAVVEWEDAGFYRHGAIDREAIREALLADLRAGKYEHGGSTITQQLARTLFLTREKTLRRKLREIILARRLEALFAKDEILEMYLNTADWGPGVAGAEAAARIYCGKPARDLEWKDAAMLAGMLANPRRFSPLEYPKKAQVREELVREKLVQEKAVSEEEYRASEAESRR
ncbi:MAG: transglycosylase domain-containing protein [Acidobacteriia bacterium]|nr:transglycosylase domain-containing protein [Terriglobia bacterium]